MVQHATNEGFKDSVAGQPLRAEHVCAARKLDLEYFVSKEVWEKRPMSAALAKRRPAAVAPVRRLPSAFNRAYLLKKFRWNCREAASTFAGKGRVIRFI